MNTPSQKFIDTFSVKTDAKTDSRFVFQKGGFRFSVLTSRLIRTEKGNFCDEPTQAVLFRNFAKPEFKICEKGNLVIISTKDTVFTFDLKKGKMKGITLKNGKYVEDFSKGNLKGTYRTLDMVNGSIPLGDGILSRNGVTIYDDSKSVIIAENGTMKERPRCSDKYYFAYGNDYRGAMADFYRLCGSVPLVPRYCLGNWWSRYKAYSQKEYLDLMNSFIEKEIPVSVATIDMDWHWTDVIERFGEKDGKFQRTGFPLHNPLELFQSQGWTGYSWNTELFPDYKAMLTELKEKGFKVTVNLHPAQGVRPYEDMYEDMAKTMDIDPKTKKHIKFDITDPKYIEAYFDILHKPYEKDGVDFWWIDWQQEKTTNVKKLDPLWALNHYHTLAFSKENKRPLILSRFAEVGSHRYPLGFSGDTLISWRSLDFQPYFTITASNVGYTWWSHDIGGHQLGRRDDELYARWVQFGQYSPINRLHSTNDEFMGKEPWKYSYGASLTAINSMRERHAMIPYLYSMNRRTHKDGIALCEPMYYTYPDKEEAYSFKNQYFFGSELLVSPVTSPMSKRTNLSATRVWLPKGRWTDIYNGFIYQGGKEVTMYRGIESLPVLAKEGAILPLSADDRTNDCSNPKEMKIRVWRGNNKFELYEDDGETMNFENGAFAVTELSVEESSSNLIFKISKADGDLSVIPEKRSYTVVFEDIVSADEIKSNKKIESIVHKEQKTVVTLKDVAPNEEVTIELLGTAARRNRDKKEIIVELLSKYQLNTIFKQLTLGKFVKDITLPFPLKDKDLKGPIDEVFALA